MVGWAVGCLRGLTGKEAGQQHRNALVEDGVQGVLAVHLLEVREHREGAAPPGQLLVVAEGQIHRALRPPRRRRARRHCCCCQQPLHRVQERHSVALVVAAAAAPDLAILRKSRQQQ
eukprot:scaffold299_cov343-Prasinococcus_capsulatus_cf.AAC.17